MVLSSAGQYRHAQLNNQEDGKTTASCGNLYPGPIIAYYTELQQFDDKEKRPVTSVSPLKDHYRSQEPSPTTLCL